MMIKGFRALPSNVSKLVSGFFTQLNTNKVVKNHNNPKNMTIRQGCGSTGF
jgi:hypothetical protein